jgi:RNA polymerase sigma factor (sigma-70 family)
LASEPSSTVMKHIAVLFRTGTATGLTDGSLLDRFRNGPAEEAEAAFAVLVERHGPMVLHVCRRILGDRHDAEDASQAVFLVLARQARSIRRTDSVASWLYGVAARVAARARLDAARRRLRERRGAEVSMAMKDVEFGDRDGAETWPELYQELGRLPERFRLPILLCHLEGLTYEQAALRLGCPVRTVQSRLARARKRLRDRLARRGVAPAIAALTAALTPDAARAAVSESWKHATVTAAVRYAAGGTAAALIPSTVAILAEGASRAMNLHRLMKWAAALLLIGVAAGGAGVAMLARSAPPEPERRATTEPDENRYRVTMAGGATFEVVALSSHYSSPKTWWRPDGTPLDESPADPSQRIPFGKEGEELLDILVRVKGLPENSTFKWAPTYDEVCTRYSGSVSKGGQEMPELRAYIASFRQGRTNCAVEIKLAAGPWKTESSHSMYVHGHRFRYGKIRAYGGGTALAIAHDLVGIDARLVAVDRQRKEHPATYSSGAGDETLGLLDAEFPLPPDQIVDYRFQTRPFELAEIKGIALQPRRAGKPTSKTEAPSPQPETGPSTEFSSVDRDVDTDGDGLSDYQEIHKYRTDPKKVSTVGDGVSDGDRQRRREFTYTICSVVKLMEPFNEACMNDDYQDVRRLLRRTSGVVYDNYVELEVIHYPLNTNAESIRGDPDWRRDAESKKEFLRPGITTNWDDAMRRDLIAALKADGIDPDRLDDKELVTRASAWLLANSKSVNMFCTHYMHYPEGRAAIYPGLEARFELEKGNRAWTVQEQLDHELFGRSMFSNRTHGSCTSTAVFLTTALRALGIPTRMVLGIPMVDGNDPAQLEMVANSIHHHRVRRTLLQGLSGAKGYANYTFNEVFVGGRWVRLNYKTLGQNSLDGSLMGLLTHVNTFNDLSDVPLAATWGKRYAKGERDAVFRYGNPYRCEEVSDHFGKFAKVENPELRY